ncbi:MAG TPA: YihY/virulence factor BrkB family protein [Flavisolibacter sp.]|nr:YihY/virulence factor BrkB family protein [Flavisolibacter sp.]
MKKFSFGLVWKSLKDAFKGFGDDKVTKLSASLAYYTVFSLAPLLIVIISIAGLVFGREAIQGSIDNQVQSFIGADAAKQLQEMIKSVAISGKGVIATIVGVVTLLIGATSIFAEIQDSINSIWGLKPKPKVGIMKTLQNRLLSFGLIGSLGFLLLVSLAATTVVESIGDRLKAFLPDVTVIVFYIVNLVLNLSVITVLFAIIFKVLPDAKIKWKDIIPGAVATCLLFLLGKFAISLYISKSEVGSTYGAAGSLAVILIWIYYSSIILYFGAEFTKSYAINKGAKIIPNQYAEWNSEPAVPGAEPKPVPANGQGPLPQHPGAVQEDVQRRGKQPESAKAVEKIQPAIRPTVILPQKEGKKAPGLGTVLFGLVLYFINNAREKKQGSFSR